MGKFGSSGEHFHFLSVATTGVSGISRSEKFSAGGNPNNPYTFGKLMSRRSDLAQLRVSNCFSSAFICSFLKGPYQGVDDIGKNGFTALAKNRKIVLKIQCQ